MQLVKQELTGQEQTNFLNNCSPCAPLQFELREYPGVVT